MESILMRGTNTAQSEPLIKEVRATDEEGAHGPDVDEDISVWGMLYGAPAHRPPLS